jgi:hypothetical protein
VWLWYGGCGGCDGGGDCGGDYCGCAGMVIITITITIMDNKSIRK